MLADAKQGLKFKDEKNDTWELRPTEGGHGQQRLDKGRRRRQEVSRPRGGRSPRNALGGDADAGAEASRWAGNGTKHSPTLPAERSPTQRTAKNRSRARASDPPPAKPRRDPPPL